MSKGTEVACVGLTILDILGRPINSIPEGGSTTIIDQIRMTPAGTAAGPVVIAAKLGMKASLVGAIGSDDMGMLLESMLKKQGVDTTRLQRRTDLPTAATMLAVNANGDRPNFHAIGATIMLEIDGPTEEFITGSRFVHWGGVGTMLNLDGGRGAEILKKAKASGATITCDFIAPQPGTLEAIKSVLPHVDYFMPSLEEAMAIAGTTTPEDTARYFLDCGTGACIFKWGAKGSLLPRATASNAYRPSGWTCSTPPVAATPTAPVYRRAFEGARRGRIVPLRDGRIGAGGNGLGSDAGVVNFAETDKAMGAMKTLD